jgi:hypothetical protein
MRNLIVSLFLIGCFILTGCPSANSIAKAKSSSARIATYANTGVELTRELYRNKFLTLSQKDKLADGWIALAKAGQAFDAAIAAAESQYGTDTPPKTAIDKLFGTFNSEVVAKFLAVLQDLKIVGGTDKFGAVIETIKTAVLLVAKVFAKKSEIAAQLAAV